MFSTVFTIIASFIITTGLYIPIKIIIFLRKRKRIAFYALESKYKSDISAFKILNRLQPPAPIVFVGDSNTELFRINEFFPDRNVVNRGIGGDTSKGLLGRLNESVIDLKPSWVFLMIGTNDLEMLKSAPEDILTNIEEILRRIREVLPETRICLYSVFPVNKGEKGKDYSMSVGRRSNREIDELNGGLQKLAERECLPFIDVAPLLKDSSGALRMSYTSDGLHINAEAYDRITKTFLKYMK